MLAEHFEEEDNDDGSDGEGLAKINQSKITFEKKALPKVFTIISRTKNQKNQAEAV